MGMISFSPEAMMQFHASVKRRVGINMSTMSQTRGTFGAAAVVPANVRPTKIRSGCLM